MLSFTIIIIIIIIITTSIHNFYSYTEISASAAMLAMQIFTFLLHTSLEQVL
jgi:uncharacterized membrane protein